MPSNIQHHVHTAPLTQSQCCIDHVCKWCMRMQDVSTAMQLITRMQQGCHGDLR